ncbi:MULTISPECIES: electron transport complex subunit RsxG [unclassified Alcanivorax]|jgi:electron transport complex protein RnfG|uniref:electron transport complex subunit RsxG n=1 Tax=unclassified Alcanivorax TaxID=2638842 RepID=UPI0007BA526F|nr:MULTISPECIES: electron transport complex subunit RsxG [unclassified Alcanivorax]KZX74411.1 electron transport complex subunit G [Alcanivorax sp. HI0013]KZX84035.1 electron transport complex subunit G [Alcanivorax sp. HI0011]KZY18347.1 electron transport complex subunit G [Alcanivorax sp. HI0035]KZX66940.1 electron transport complex subunit G [Alcanivorax sp. HI0007]KZX68661.1 electron transport complex subunit G [Alcanivorax sp. HI0003]
MMRYAITKNAVILSLFAISTAAALAITNELTIGKVECNKQAALMASLNEVMPHDRHDNDLLADRITVSDPLLGRNGHHIYRARQDGEPNGAVLEATAPDGYGGNIALIVGVDMQGKVQGVRVVPPHNETPGLGDKIETKKSGWIYGFNGLSLGNPADAGWAVKKDGGQFDSFTGATITPRAVVGAVHRALQYFDANQTAVFEAPSEAAPAETCDE